MGTTYEKYREHRTAHPFLPAVQAYRWATSDESPGIEWEDGRNGLPVAEWEESGFTIRATTDYDNYPDVSWLGEIKRRPEGHEYIRRQDGTYYVPCNSWVDNWRALRRDHSRHDAYTLARGCALQDMRMLETLGDEWSLLTLTVTASRAGVELGRDVICGVDVIGRDLSHLTECARDCVAGAIAEAREALKALCGQSA